MSKPIGPGPIQGKLWGTTQLLYEYNGTEVHEIKPEKGGYCSKHIHKYKWNRFIVMKGKLKITIFEPSEEPNVDPIEDVTILGAGMSSDVPPGKLHIFEALEDSIALECYWVVLDAGDIVRHSVGGIKDAQDKS